LRNSVSQGIYPIVLYEGTGAIMKIRFQLFYRSSGMRWILFVMFWIRNANLSVHMVHSCIFVVKINLKVRHSTVSTVVRQKTRVLSMQDIIILAKDGAGLKSLLRILLMKESSTHYMKQITVNVFISLIIMLWTIKDRK